MGPPHRLPDVIDEGALSTCCHAPAEVLGLHALTV
jgi:hypothetical protein